jgi:hypothetical protein
MTMWRALTVTAVLLPAAARAGGYGYGGYGQGVQYAHAMIKGGKLVVRQYYLEYMPQQKTRNVAVEKDGKTVLVPQTYTVMVLVPKEMRRTFDAARVQATDPAGKKVSPEALRERLEDEKLVLLRFAGQELDARYRTILKKETLILTVPPPTPGMPREDDKAVPPTEKVVPDKEVSAPALYPTGLQGKAAPPRGPQPTLAGASVDAKGILSVRESGGMTSVQTLYREEEKDGQVTRVAVRVKDVFMTQRVRSLSASGAQAFRADGKAVSPAALRALLKKETPVLVSLNGRPVDPYYLQVYRSDTLVLVVPVAGYGPPPVPAPETPKSEKLTPKT